jgi:hypothetical protein
MYMPYMKINIQKINPTVIFKDIRMLKMNISAIK